MKKAIPFLILLNYLTATAQYPGATNNFYTYNEHDSVFSGSNYVPTVFNNGSILYWQYGVRLRIKGNNYVRSAPPPLDGDILHPQFYRLDDNSVWVTQGNKAYLLTEEKIIDSFSCNGEIGWMIQSDGENRALRFSYKIGDSSFLGSYQKQQVKQSASPGFAIGPYAAFWKTKKGQLFFGTPAVYCELLKEGFGPVLRYTLPQRNYYIQNGSSPLDAIIASTPVANNAFNLYRIQSSKLIKINTGEPLKFSTMVFKGFMAFNYSNQQKEIIQINDTGTQVISRFSSDDLITNVNKASSGSFYLGGQNKLIRTFSYIKKFPNIFNSNHSSSIFALQQDSKGAVWAGSYLGRLSRIDKNGVQPINTNNILIMNGGTVIGDKVYLIGESESNGLLQFKQSGQYRKITKEVSGFINYVDSSNGILYFGTSGKGLWFTKINTLNDKTVNWKVISHEQGNHLPNILTITKDKKGRLWLGQASRGWAVYNPATNKVHTWLIEKNETDFGLMSSFTDNRGTVWLGSKQRGLLYYNNYRSDTVAANDIQQIVHPLLVNGKMITAIKQWGDWLLFGAMDNYLAFDLKTWYATKKVLIRYLNPQEVAFTGTTEQNTLLVDKRDSSVWFSTTDMLYQWDFKQWLSLPLYKVAPNVEMVLNGQKFKLDENKSFSLEPVENNLNFSVWFQSPDNMPRYLSVALFKKGDSLNFPAVRLATYFNYVNLAPGKYILAVQICQSDGSITIHQFPVIIKNFWWQLWWVWLSAFIICTLLAVYIINIRRKKKLAEAVIQRKEAEMEAFKEAQQKKLAHLQLVSLSNQFRPHFILNALNTIGAQMDKNPQAESVLSRLGESINLIFNHAQQQKMAHSFADEWTLVKNIISIHQLMYLKKLETKLPGEETLQLLENSIVPLGLLQIPVENALLHGLSNKEIGPWLLEIIIENNADNFKVKIIDNGVGRIKAGTLSNYRKHGTGTKNLSEILTILNENKLEKITIIYQDNIFTDAVDPYGTSVIVTLPKTFNYDA